ncbi:alanine racemase [Desulfohalotomaculum tongense]|uniref:alanine racemase n=1 Tax=Desulforadius tongensis TaxID=1216062 RepID=UPI00195CE474|nr:alanine racemase [Desulforadius tongensis]MBM7854880.1 alanine racemase [Desulforadius tongensis]
MTSHPIWAEIDLTAIAHNLHQVRRVTKPGTKIMAVVKANAYGHGLVEVAETVLANGADYLAVARLNEAMLLRRRGIKSPILIFGYTPPEQYIQVINNNFTQTVYTLAMARELNSRAEKCGSKVKIHIKIDTGMGRLGFIPGDQAVKEIKEITKLSHLEVEGIYTHFADADNADKTYTNKQFAKFINLLNHLSKMGISFKIRHAANSAAVIDHPETHLDMVRPGIMLYGLYPSEDVQKNRVSLRPAMALKTRVSHVKKVPPGTHISYGCRYCTESETVIASLPLGYADGYTRMLNNSEVLVHGQRAPVVGRICMDQCMINVGHINDVKTGDEVVVFGCQNNSCIPVEELAQKLGTINYELVCMVSARVPRVYKNS